MVEDRKRADEALLAEERARVEALQAEHATWQQGMAQRRREAPLSAVHLTQRDPCTHAWVQAHKKRISPQPDPNRMHRCRYRYMHWSCTCLHTRVVFGRSPCAVCTQADFAGSTARLRR